MTTSISAFDLKRLVVVVSEDVLFQELDGEAVLLSLESGQYYGLNEVASKAWSLFQEHTKLEHVLSELLTSFDVPEETLEADLRVFLSDLGAHKLVTFCEDAT